MKGRDAEYAGGWVAIVADAPDSGRRFPGAGRHEEDLTPASYHPGQTSPSDPTGCFPD
ncbi:hypothetical protein ASNO1_76570 [Corallococcus caeni]|uniref:Uncharacterized protein n=1 Tax=Corallococcus caeni TaxID=3082388 RepID=A0ABQ6R514_9BACT|nr:hypothetical protein ASNO1_76570 [Corallococcus sp. NO1]